MDVTLGTDGDTPAGMAGEVILTSNIGGNKA